MHIIQKLLPVLLTFALAAGSSAQTIDWSDSLEEAQKLAQQNSLPVMAHFSYEGCDSCAQFSLNVLPHPLVQARGAAGFNWVKIDREKYPAHTKTFAVNDFPSFLVLGPKNENIHRFHGVKRVPYFLEELERARDKWTLFLEGKDWLAGDAPNPLLSDGAQVRELPAPLDKLPRGMALHAGKLLVVQKGALHFLDPNTGHVEHSRPIAPGVVDICSDGEFIYALEYGWTAGRPIRMLDPASGKELHRIVTEENKGRADYSALGIAAVDGKLIVAGNTGWLYVVEPETGTILRSVKTSVRSLRGLDYDGEQIVAATDDGLSFFETESGRFKTVGQVPTFHPLRVVAFGRGEYFVMGQPLFGYDKRHARVRTWPDKARIFALIPTGPVESVPGPEKVKQPKLSR